MLNGFLGIRNIVLDTKMKSLGRLLMKSLMFEQIDLIIMLIRSIMQNAQHIQISIWQYSGLEYSYIAFLK